MFSKNDRKNIRHAGNIFIAKMCLAHCWPEDGDVECIDEDLYSDKEDQTVLSQWVREACGQGNTHARHANRAESTLDDKFFAEVSRVGFSIW